MSRAFLLHDISLYGNIYKVQPFLYKAARKLRVPMSVDSSLSLNQPIPGIVERTIIHSLSALKAENT